MLWEQVIELRDQAAAKTFERIRADRERASRKVEPLLRYIEGHLFDSGLDVQRLRRDLAVRDNSVTTLFRRETGLAPKAYISDCRLEVGARLLGATELRIWEISEALGYATMPVFSHAFIRWAGVPPTKYRERGQPPARRLEGGPGIRLPELRRALRGEIRPEEADRLLRRLEILYPASAPPEASAPLEVPEAGEAAAVDGARYDRLRARALWERLRDRPLEEQRRLLGGGISFGSCALFDLLRRKSREVGRQDRRRGVEIAELAVVSLAGGEDRLGERFPDLLARGWAWVANARRLVADHLGAEQAILEAEKCWRRPRAARDPMVRAEILGIKSSQRLFQGELEEALELVDRALEIFRRGDDPAMSTNFLIHRAMVLVSSGRASEAVGDLTEAFLVLESHPEPSRLLLAVYSISARLLAEIGRARPALRALRKAEALCRGCGDELHRYQLLWTEGLIRAGTGELEEAERLLSTARESFAELRSSGHLAMVSLDLALLYLRQGRHDDVIALVASVVPILEGLCFQKRTLGILQLLRQAVGEKTVTPAFLQEVRLVCLRGTL